MSRRRRSPISHRWLAFYPLPIPLLIYLANPANLEQASLPPLTLKLTLLHTLSIGLVSHGLLEWLGPSIRRRSKPYRVVIYIALMQVSVLLGILVALPIANEIIPFAKRRLFFGWYVAAVYTTAFGTLSLSIESLWSQNRESRRKAELELQARKAAEYAALQAICSSHFLFNSLNILVDLIHEDPQAAEEMTLSLSNLMRYSLNGAREPYTSVSKEIDSVRDYLHIQSIRFGDRVTWSISLPKEVEEAAVPAMSIQPIVENAVLHGFSGGRKRCTVAVDITRKHDRLYITVRDDGPGPGNSTREGTGTSLDGLRTRLSLLYEKNAMVTISSDAESGGCLVSIEIPFQTWFKETP